MYKHTLTTLENGLRIITVPMKGVESMTVMVGVGAGSRYETKETNGLSHFLEHMVFKGTQKRPTTLDISVALDSIGAKFNAATSKEFTFYYVKANAVHQPLAFEILTDMVLNSKFDPEEIERERGVIIEEINMYEDMPIEKVVEVFESLLYSPTSLGWYTAGKRENVKAITREDFVNYQKRLYYPGNMVVVKAGKVESKECLELTEKYFGRFKAREKEKYEPAVFNQREPRVRLRQKKTSQSHFCVGFRAYHQNHPDRFVLDVLSTLLGGSMSSRMFIQVRERRGLAYYVKTVNENYSDNGYLMTRVGVDIGKIDEALKVILDEYQKVIFEKVEASELQKAKEFLKGNFILSLEDSQSVAEDYTVETLLDDKIRDPEEIIQEIEKVTAQDLQRVAKDIFRPENLNLAVIGPYNDEERFLKLLRQF
jgi:predicted Zn-dependent peptidase